MRVFDRMTLYEHEQVIWCFDRPTGLRAIIAIHNTSRGPALGGTRMYPYKNEKDALDDVLRLAQGMTFKAAVAGLPLGGGKAVIIGDPARDKSEALLRAYGKFLNTLNGRFITAEDAGTCLNDMDIIRKETAYVAGTSLEAGGSGDPSPLTALGVFLGIKAALGEVYGTEEMTGKCIAVQGVGKVGAHLLSLLAGSGARLIVSDANKERAAEAASRYGAQIVAPEEIYAAECDVFAPCALGGVINKATISRLRCRIIAGAANNVLAGDRYGDMLHRQGILYVPDYVINGGGLINVATELEGYRRDKAEEKVKGIYGTVRDVLARAKREGIPPFRAAASLAREKLSASPAKNNCAA